MNYRGTGRGSCLGKKGPPSCETSPAITDWVPYPSPRPGRPQNGDWCVEEFLGNTGHQEERGKGKEAGMVRGSLGCKAVSRTFLASLMGSSETIPHGEGHHLCVRVLARHWIHATPRRCGLG